MFVQVLIGEEEEEKRDAQERMLISRDLYGSSLSFCRSFFLTHTHDRWEIVEDIEEKSCRKPIASACLANERCQRSAERARDKYQKNDRKTTTTTTTAESISRGLIKKKKKYNIEKLYKHELNGFYH
jgi:hypothetical protein